MTEKQIHQAILEYLRRCMRKGVFVTTIEMGTKTASERKRFARAGAVFGFPDILFIYEGRAYCFEVKTPKGPIQQNQIDCMRELSKAGALATVVRCVEDVYHALCDFGLYPHSVPIGTKRRYAEAAA